MSDLTFENTDERIIVLDDERYLRIKTYRTQGQSLTSLSDEQFVMMLMEQPFYDHHLIGSPRRRSGGGCRRTMKIPSTRKKGLSLNPALTRSTAFSTGCRSARAGF